MELQTFLTSVLDEGELLASSPGHFTAGEKALGSYCIGHRRLVSLGAVLDEME
jgi:hypothetical protein